MKLTLKATGEKVDVKCSAEAHVGMANGTFERQTFPRSKGQIAKREAKTAAAKKRIAAKKAKTAEKPEETATVKK